jgi:hypothetical protein
MVAILTQFKGDPKRRIGPINRSARFVKRVAQF